MFKRHLLKIKNCLLTPNRLFAAVDIELNLLKVRRYRICTRTVAQSYLQLCSHYAPTILVDCDLIFGVLNVFIRLLKEFLQITLELYAVSWLYLPLIFELFDLTENSGVILAHLLVVER